MFDENNSMKITFYRPSEMNGSNYLKNPLKISAIIIIENDDK